MRLLLAATAVALLACGRAPLTSPARAVVAPPVAPTPPPAPAVADTRPGRGLTPAERALVHPIFGDSLDYGAVRVIAARYFPFQPAGVYMTPEGSIFAPGDLYRDDFAPAPVAASSVFVHEMTHVWQYQMGKDLLAEGLLTFATNLGAYERAYTYRLDPAHDLLDYGMEQQASIVEDYFRLHHGEAPRRAAPPFQPGNYRLVLAAFLADPGYARGRSVDAIAQAHARAARALMPSQPAADAGAYLCAWRLDPRRGRRP